MAESGKCTAVLLTMLFLVVLSGCQQPAGSGTGGEAGYATACVNLCMEKLAEGTNFGSGPCIGNPLQEYPDWVCDVAHSPREAADNLPENQCPAFREGKAKHFVEVDEGCRVIKVY